MGALVYTWTVCYTLTALSPCTHLNASLCVVHCVYQSFTEVVNTGWTNVNLLCLPDTIEIASLERLTLWCSEINQSKRPLAWWRMICMAWRHWPSTALQTLLISDLRQNASKHGRHTFIYSAMRELECNGQLWARAALRQLRSYKVG